MDTDFAVAGYARPSPSGEITVIVNGNTVLGIVL